MARSTRPALRVVGLDSRPAAPAALGPPAATFAPTFARPGREMYEVGDLAFVVTTWTADLWARLPALDRPADARLTPSGKWCTVRVVA